MVERHDVFRNVFPGGGVYGRGRKALPSHVRAVVEARWRDIVTPVTGHATYRDMVAELTGQAFPFSD